MPQDHQSIREGARLGLLVASTSWLWLAIVDALAGQPFHTFTVLGGALTFTVLHYLLIRTHPVREELQQAEGEENE
jgi:hypothetical protein